MTGANPRSGRRSVAIKLAIGVVPFALNGVAFAAASAPVILSPRGLGWLGLLMAFPVYVLTLASIAGLVGRSARCWIVPGRFERDVSTPLYRGRILYGTAWTSIFYNRLAYHAILCFPPLKAWTFRLFGYKGSLDFTIYPDSWIRDLPLLDFGRGVYISNRATIGTNLVQQDGRILVGGVRLEERVLIGHLAMIAPGCELGAGTEIGVGCAIGLKVKTGRGVRIGPTTSVNHGASLGEGVVVDSMCLIGRRVTIAAGVHIPPGTIIPDRQHIASQADVKRFAGRGRLDMR